MIMIKCIVCDLDGTLIKKDDTIEEITYQKLKTCMNQGIEFMIATGRDLNMVLDFLNKYELDCDLILNNGTQFCKKDLSMNEIYPMDNDSFIKIAHILNRFGYLLAIHTNKGKYSLHDTEEFWKYHIQLITSHHGCSEDELPKKTFTTREGYLRDFHYAKTPEEIINKGIKVLKIDARHKDVYSLTGVKEQLNIPNLEYSSSYEDNIEITTNTSNKGQLLEDVVKRKGYHKDEVAVFGDGENDVQMLENFTYSFAPQNAGDSAKNAAHYVTQKNNEEGAVGEGIDILQSMNLL